MANIGNEVVRVVVEFVDQITKDLDATTKKFKNFKGVVDGLASAFAPISLASAAALGGSLKLAVDFEKSMAEARKSLDYSVEELEEFKKAAQQIQRNVSFQLTTAQLASLAAEAGKLGVPKDTKSLSNYVEGLVNLAVATDNLKNIDQLNTRVAKINQIFKMGQDDLNEWYAAVNKISNTTAANANELIAFTNVMSGQGKTAGMTAKQVTAWGGALVGAGLKVHNSEGFMRKLISNLSATRTWGKRTARAFDSLGLSAEEVGKRFHQDANAAMVETLETLQKLKASDPQEFSNVMAEMFGQEWVGKGKLASVALEDIINNLKKVEDQAGNSALMMREFEVAATSVPGQLTAMKNIINELGVQIGSALLPAILSLLKAITPLILKLTEIAQKHPGVTKVIVALLGIGAVIAPILMFASAMTSAITTITALTPVVASLLTPVGILIGVLKTSLAPAVGLAVKAAVGFVTAAAPWITAIAAVGAAVFLLVKNWAAVKAATISTINTMKPGFNSFISWINSSFTGLVKSLYSGTIKPIEDAVMWALNGIVDAVMNTWNKLMGFGSKLAEGGRQWGKDMLQGFIDGLASMYGNVQQAMDNFTNWLGQYLPHSDAKKGELSRLTDSGRAFAQTFLNAANQSLLNPMSGLALQNAGGSTLGTPQSNQGSRGGLVNINITNNITASDTNDLVQKLKDKDRDFIIQFNQSNNRINREAY